MYELVSDPVGLAEAYVRRWFYLARYIESISPRARVRTQPNGVVVFKYTAVGERWLHHVYVTFRPDPDKNMGFFIVRPAYPMYLLASALPFLMFGVYVAVAVPRGELRGVPKEVVLVLVQDYDLAVKLAAEALQRLPLLDPSRFTADEGVGFEGILRKTPVGYVAFVHDKEHFPKVDVVVEHLEDETDEPDIMHPAEFAKSLAERLLEKTS